MQGRTVIKRRKKRLSVVEPPRARRNDPETSQEAAASITNLRVWWAEILTFYDENDRGRGWNTYEATRGLDLGECHWKRVSECVQLGWLQLVVGIDGKPLKRPGKTTRKQQCYRITEAGREVLADAVER